MKACVSKLSPRAEERITEAMEKWARWRAARSGDGLGWPHITITGKILAGMPSTKCTLCDGRERIPGWKVGVAMQWIECPRCDGEGKIKADPGSSRAAEAACKACVCPGTGRPTGEVGGKTCIKCRGRGKVTNHAAAVVNPAFIQSTSAPSFRADDDPISQRIDWLVCTELTEYQREIVIHEYARHGSQAKKAAKLEISQGYYSRVLAEAREVLAAGLYGSTE